MNNLLRLLSCILIISLSLVACSSNPSSESSNNPTNEVPADSKPITTINKDISISNQTSNKNNNDITNAKQPSINNKETDTNKPSSKNNDKSPTAKEPSIKNVKCRLYFFNTSELKHYYIDKTIPVKDNALITALTDELKNTSYNKDFLSLTNKVSVKSAKIDEKTGILKVVFSDSYVNYMLLGTGTESGLLLSLLATYGYNLGVKKAVIYFNDEPYTGLGDFDKGYFLIEYPPAEKYTP